MTDIAKSSFDEESAIEAAQERRAIPHLRDVFKREHNEVLKKELRDGALEERVFEIKEMMMEDP